MAFVHQSGAEDSAKVLDNLLRGEISAAETYKLALDGVRDQRKPQALDIREIELEHGEAIRALRRLVLQCGGRPSDTSGPWGLWAKTVEGTARLFGDKAALKALKEGEEHGLKSYERALEDERMPLAGRDLIRGTLLPQTRSHVAKLDHMMKTIS